jgi:hypothetical protein
MFFFATKKLNYGFFFWFITYILSHNWANFYTIIEISYDYLRIKTKWIMFSFHDNVNPLTASDLILRKYQIWTDKHLYCNYFVFHHLRQCKKNFDGKRWWMKYHNCSMWWIEIKRIFLTICIFNYSICVEHWTILF